MIENCPLAKSGGDASGANLRSYTYQTNASNQYTLLNTPATFDVIGRSPVEAGDHLTSNLGPVIRQGQYYRSEGTANHTTAADWKSILLIYVPATADATVQTGHLFIPPATVVPTYDADGNLTRDGRWNYFFDAENRLIAMTSIDTNKPRMRRIDFRYDWMGRRIEKKVSEDVSGTGVLSVIDQRRFVYDGWNLLAEYTVNASGNLVPDRYYTWGTDLSGSEQGAGGVGGLLSVSDHGTPYMACYDGNGNIIAWMDANGQVAGRQDYDPFGNRMIEEGVQIPLGFSTKYEDRETGLLYYGYRYYSPSLGRWISKDPIEERGGMNLYGFVGNNGIGKWDYLRLELPEDLKCCNIKKIIVNFN